MAKQKTKKTKKATKAAAKAELTSEQLLEVSEVLHVAQGRVREVGDTKTADRVKKLGASVAGRAMVMERKAERARAKATAKLEARMEALAKAAREAGVDPATLLRG